MEELYLLRNWFNKYSKKKVIVKVISVGISSNDRERFCMTLVFSLSSCERKFVLLRDWSLIMRRGGGLQNGRGGGGTLSFTPMKRGGGKSFSHAKGGAQKVLG